MPGAASDGLDATANAEAASLTLNFGALVNLGSVAMCNGNRHRDKGTYTLKASAGTVLETWMVSTSRGGTNRPAHAVPGIKKDAKSLTDSAS